MAVADRALVSVNGAKCTELARWLRSAPIPAPLEEIRFEGFDSVEAGQLLLFIVAICHQTSGLSRAPLEGNIDGKLLRGGDYLLQKFGKTVRSDRTLLQATSWTGITAENLTLSFRNDSGQDLLQGLERRAELVRDLGLVMRGRGWQNFQQMYDDSEGRIATGRPNLLGGLTEFQAYSDPVRKKSFFLLALMRNAGNGYEQPGHFGTALSGTTRRCH